MPTATTLVSFSLAALVHRALPRTHLRMIRDGLLGSCFVLLAAGCDALYAAAAGSLAPRIHRSPRVHRRLQQTTGTLYLGLAGVTALT